MNAIWKWIDHNRFVVTLPIIGILLWFYAISCTPITFDPLISNRRVDARELQQSFEIWQAEQGIIAKKFELAGEDIEYQKEQNKKIEDMIINLASANVADLPGLVTLLIGGGGLGAIVDNVRKRSLISGLKRNKE